MLRLAALISNIFSRGNCLQICCTMLSSNDTFCFWTFEEHDRIALFDIVYPWHIGT